MLNSLSSQGMIQTAAHRNVELGLVSLYSPSFSGGNRDLLIGSDGAQTRGIRV